MIKLFFITFFIAELIIVTAIIIKIYKFNKQVVRLNKKILRIKENVKDIFIITREVLGFFNESIDKIKKYIKQKKDEYLIILSKKILLIIGFLSLKGKYKKMYFVYEFGKDIYRELKQE